MSHRAGLPCVDASLTLDDVCDWRRMTSLLAAQAPYWTPGTGHGYHAVTNGFLGGELVCRVDPQQRSYSRFVREELGNEIFVGVPDDTVEHRVARLIRKVGQRVSKRCC
jgi:CubicO group peptidase (beta-lactamase class C family)